MSDGKVLKISGTSSTPGGNFEIRKDGLIGFESTLYKILSNVIAILKTISSKPL